VASPYTGRLAGDGTKNSSPRIGMTDLGAVIVPFSYLGLENEFITPVLPLSV